MCDKGILYWYFTPPSIPPSIFLDSLSSDERKRARSFVFDKDRNFYIFGRGLLRSILAKYLGITPKQILFTYNSFGKPATPSLYFNLSHSSHQLLIALSSEKEMGVDIERIRHIPENVHENSPFFSAEEQKHILSAKNNQNAFFTCWTRKEALIKAIGEGMSFSLLSQLSTLSSSVMVAEQFWTIENLPASIEYSAALAYKGKECPLIKMEQPWQEFV